MAKINQIKMGSFLSYLQMGLNVIIGLVYTPVMINLLGKSEYGLYQTVASTMSLLSVLSLGFNASYVRYYSKYKQKDDIQNIYRLNGLFIIIFSIIGLVALVCGLFLTFHLELVFDTGLSATEYDTARVLMFIETLSLAIMFPASVLQSIISANEKYVFLKLVGMLTTICSPLISLPLLLAGYRSVMLVSVTFSVSIFSYCIQFCYVIKSLKNKFVFYGFEKGIIKDLFIYTSFLAINLVVDQINNNIDKILLGRFKGTNEVAVYSVGYMLYSYYMTFSTSISGVFTPRIHAIVNRYQDNICVLKKELTNIFIKVGRIQFLILGLVATGVIFFGKEFICFYWVGDGYDTSYYVALLLILPATIALVQNTGIEIQRAQNLHYFRSIAYLIMAIGNLILSIFLCQRYGAVGSAVGTAISLILANGIIINIYYQLRCNINIVLFWKNIGCMSKGLILPIVTGILLRKTMNFNSIMHFFGSICIYSVVYFFSMWFLSMSDYEKNLVTGFLNRIKRKK